MKFWMVILALALLLTGCGSAPAEPTTTPAGSTATTAPTDSTDPTDPPPAPEPLRVQHLDRAYEWLVPMGDKLILMGEDILSLYTPNGVAVTTALSLPHPDSGSLRVTEDAIIYYDAAENAMIWLDQALTETNRVTLSEAVTGTPWISADGQALYYCTPEGIRVYDVPNHISRNLKVHAGDWLGISGSILDHTQLICQLKQPDDSIRLLLIDTETGATTYEGEALSNITGSGDFYCCITDSEWIFGQAGDQPQNLLVDRAIPLPQIQAAYTVSQENGLVLDLYDLNTGRHSAQLSLSDMTAISTPVVWQDNLVFLSDSQLCFWDRSLSPVEDETLYAAYRYTADDPDTEGLAALQARAEALGKQYGIEILLWNDITAVQPEGYQFEVEHRTLVYEEAFTALEAALAQLPEGFLKTAASWTEDGTLHIVLARSITTPDDECGSQYLLGWNAYIPLALDGDLTRSFYHGLGHVIDTQVLSHSDGFYEWDTLNPSGFKYDKDYDSWQDRESKYLSGSNRYFVNSLAMTFPVEDRAGLFEYAMTEGNEEVFSSKQMQKKLKRLKTGLREAFDLEGDSYLWEQYLK